MPKSNEDPVGTRFLQGYDVGDHALSFNLFRFISSCLRCLHVDASSWFSRPNRLCRGFITSTIASIQAIGNIRQRWLYSPDICTVVDITTSGTPSIQL